MDYDEQLAKAILEMAHERINADNKNPRPFIQPLGCCNIEKYWERTFYRRRLMELLGISIPRRWLRKQ